MGSLRELERTFLLFFFFFSSSENKKQTVLYVQCVKGTEVNTISKNWKRARNILHSIFYLALLFSHARTCSHISFLERYRPRAPNSSYTWLLLKASRPLCGSFLMNIHLCASPSPTNSILAHLLVHDTYSSRVSSKQHLDPRASPFTMTHILSALTPVGQGMIIKSDK